MRFRRVAPDLRTVDSYSFCPCCTPGMAAIHFDDDAIATVNTNNTHGGVYSIRQRRENDARSIQSDDLEDLKRESDLKQSQEFSGWNLLWLAWQATGSYSCCRLMFGSLTRPQVSSMVTLALRLSTSTLRPSQTHPPMTTCSVPYPSSFGPLRLSSRSNTCASSCSLTVSSTEPW